MRVTRETNHDKVTENVTDLIELGLQRTEDNGDASDLGIGKVRIRRGEENEVIITAGARRFAVSLEEIL